MELVFVLQNSGLEITCHADVKGKTSAGYYVGEVGSLIHGMNGKP